MAKEVETKPLTIQRHITLSVDKPLDGSIIKKWYCCVKKYSPSGVMATIQSVDKGAPKAVKLIHRAMSNKELYMIPLSRDLLPDEVEKIVSGFANENPDLDFDIETHANFQSSIEKKKFSLDNVNYLSFCTALAKQKHDDWMKEKIESDWRYGPELDVDQKTHPLLLPWEQLPDRYKEPDFMLPQKMLSLLKDEGYAIIAKNDLEKLLKRAS
jgi:hypothetical protein